MKKTKPYLLALFSVFILSTAFRTINMLGKNEKSYKTSSLEDLSFEERFIQHQDEVDALGNYFSTIEENPTVIEDYTSLVKVMTDDAVSSISALGKSTNTVATDATMVTDEDLTKVNNVINETKDIVSPQLKNSLITLGEYISLAVQVDYTKENVFIDATGDTYENYAHTLAKGRGRKERSKGLQSKEAVRKLKELLQAKNELAEMETNLIIFPNPIIESSEVSFYNASEGTVLFTLIDLNGRTLSEKTMYLEEGTVARSFMK